MNDLVRPAFPEQGAIVAAFLQHRPLRLNVGSGVNIIPGYCNLDIQAVGGVQPDIYSDAKSLPFPDGSVDELMAIHVFEHFYRWECPGVLREWARVMRPGALLVLELPDLIKCCLNVAHEVAGSKHPEQLGLWGLYGDPREEDHYMTHKWGWSFGALQTLVEENGFGRAKRHETKYHGAGFMVRDMRLEAIRK